MATYNDLKLQWERARALENHVYRRPRKVRPASADQVVEALDRYHRHTGEGAFAEAARLINKHKLGQKRISGNKSGVFTAALRYVDLLIRKGAKLRKAAAMAARRYVVPGKSFDGVVERLETAYRKLASARPSAPRRR